MKLAMHIDKSQVASIVKVTSGTSSFKRTPAIQAGYKTIDIMCVGGGGGRITSGAYGQYGAGGAGGGSIRARVLLTALAQEATSIGVGAKGADASVSAYEAASGGESYFGTWHAYGGGGANSPQDLPLGDLASYGGEGGGNSNAQGTGGLGGSARGNYNGNQPYNQATNGTYVDAGNGNGGGRGGGGGAGRSTEVGHTSTQDAGAHGNVSAMQDNGKANVGNNGGHGGGANIATITGVAEYYGGGVGGVVAYKLT